MSKLELLKSANSLSDLANLLGYKPAALSFIIYKIPDDKKYTTFEISKKSGGVRIIKAPTLKLKRLQKKLSELLTECEKEIFQLYPQHRIISHGFRKKYSIITNASIHKNRRYVFNIDLKEFFPTINFGRIRGFFIKNSHFGLNEKVATIITQIACDDNSLPQGSPCSPVISNLIGNILDIRMVNLAKRAKCTYTRYADDLTFSTNNKYFPELIAYPITVGINPRLNWIVDMFSKALNIILRKKPNLKFLQYKRFEDKWMPSEVLIKDINKMGFIINQDKISMQYSTSRQVTTGLVVNEKVNVKQEYYKLTRSMCHSLYNNGVYYIYKKNNNSGEIEKSEGSPKQLEGRLSFIYQVKLYNVLQKDKYENRKNCTKHFHAFINTDTSVRLYKQFLYHKNFFTLDKPLIVCEGKTDSIYLKCAIKSLAASFPSLVSKGQKNHDFQIKFLKKSKQFLSVCNIGDGESGLASLMENYQEEMKRFKGSGFRHPVILLIDNDKGAEGIIKKITSKLGKIELFQRYAVNLYIVIIPKIAKKDTAIEDYFEPAVLATTLNGKKFSRKDKFDKDTEYSKMIFAKYVIENNWQKINFDAFKDIYNYLSM